MVVAYVLTIVKLYPVIVTRRGENCAAIRIVAIIAPVTGIVRGVLTTRARANALENRAADVVVVCVQRVAT